MTHTPRVEIKTPQPKEGQHVPNILTLITVDGYPWPVTAYSVNGDGVDGIQTVTLTFLADVTIAHPEPR